MGDLREQLTMYQRLRKDAETEGTPSGHDPFHLRLGEIRDRHVEPAAHLTVGVLGQTNCARPGDPFQSRSDVDAVAHQVAGALLDDVAK
jgi:hypothetical protein